MDASRIAGDLALRQEVRRPKATNLTGDPRTVRRGVERVERGDSRSPIDEVLPHQVDAGTVRRDRPHPRHQNATIMTTTDHVHQPLPRLKPQASSCNRLVLARLFLCRTKAL